jgi:hypothetical protein
LEIAPRFPLSHSLNNNKTNPHKPSKPDTSRAMKTGHFNLSTTTEAKGVKEPVWQLVVVAKCCHDLNRTSPQIVLTRKSRFATLIRKKLPLNCEKMAI